MSMDSLNQDGEKMKCLINPLVFFCLLIVLSVSSQAVLAQDLDDWEENDAPMVGRISHVEGYLSRFDPETDDWVATPLESPFGTEDLLRTDGDGKAEFILPNSTWVRIDGDTRIQLLALTPQLTEVDLPMGNARFYNKSAQTEITAVTPFGRIVAPPGTTFDLYVDEDGVDLVAIRNSVFFHHNASSRRHEVRSDSSALFANTLEVTAIAGEGDPEWNAWNQNMDNLWAERTATRGPSADYLPPELHTESYALDRHGHWERVYYEGQYYRFWRPAYVGAGWSPFSYGAWVVWHGDHVWIPHEPFGYVTCHYGNWIHTAGYWYWAPPVTRVMVRTGRPLLHIGFGWYPGRVSWIHSGAYVGWIPLAPFEPYYTHRRWGRRCVPASHWKGHRRHIVHKHRDHAVVIHRSHLYRSADYRYNRIRSIPRQTIHAKFRSTRLPDSAVLLDHRHRQERDRFYPNRPEKKPQPRTSLRPRNEEIPGGAVGKHRNDQIHRQRSAQRRQSISNDREPHRGGNEIRHRRPQPQVRPPVGNRTVQKNPIIRPNQDTRIRTGGHHPAAVRPPAVHRQPQNTVQTAPSISIRPQQQSGRQWQPSSDRRGRGNGRNSSRE